METFEISILAADHPFYTGPCESLIVPTVEGEYGIWAHHSNMISAILPGTLHYKLPGQPMQYAAISEGFLKIEGNEVLVLVDTAERPEEIEINRAKRDADEAREILLQKKSVEEYHFAQANLARAINRLRVRRQYYDESQ